MTPSSPAAVPWAEVVARMGGPVVAIEEDAERVPVVATAAGVVRAPAARVWSVASDVVLYPGNVPMIERVRRDGDRVEVELRFRIALFSVAFRFVTTATHEEGRWLDLRYVRGEPSDIRIRTEVEDLEPGASSLLRVRIGFDVMSVGWLVKTFLRHHPEIRFGIIPGCALALHDGLRRLAERTR